MHLAIRKKVFFLLRLFGCSFGFAFQSLRMHSYNNLNHSKWRRIEKDLPKCSMTG
jgi:hypothetical protein